MVPLRRRKMRKPAENSQLQTLLCLFSVTLNQTPDPFRVCFRFSHKGKQNFMQHAAWIFSGVAFGTNSFKNSQVVINKFTVVLLGFTLLTSVKPQDWVFTTTTEKNTLYHFKKNDTLTFVEGMHVTRHLSCWSITLRLHLSLCTISCYTAISHAHILKF